MWKNGKNNYILYTIYSVAINLMNVSIFDIARPSMVYTVHI